MKLRLVLLILSVLFVVACGGKKDDVKSPDAEPSMDDALALLPGNAIAVGTVDARAFFVSKTFVSELAKVVEK